MLGVTTSFSAIRLVPPALTRSELAASGSIAAAVFWLSAAIGWARGLVDGRLGRHDRLGHRQLRMDRCRLFTSDGFLHGRFGRPFLRVRALQCFC